MDVHNHGAEEGAGLACNELRLPDGSLLGACQATLYDLMIVAEYQASVKFMIDQYARFGIYVTEEHFSPNPAWVAEWKERDRGNQEAEESRRDRQA